MKLENKVCLITGGTRGIGAAAAVELARQGAHIAVASRFLDEEAEAVGKAVEGAGRAFMAICADLGKPEDAGRCVREAAEAMGGIDILIHAAGGPAKGTILEVSPETWYEAFDIHIHGAYHLCRAAVPLMKTRGEGAIILVSSVAGIRGVPGIIAYSTVKGAILEFTRALARDLADDNIRVNCVAPGIIRTRFHASMTPEQFKHNIDNRIPLHREGKPEDVAQAIALLATNDFITGESLVIDGGMTMRVP
ncbi:MAG: SDR family oxidoreductase [Armatimonadetes bacterium]|nr:SDR family oxidoreductase [Armatimonadota bacterium]